MTAPSDLDRRTAVLTLRQGAARQALMVAFATKDGKVEGEIRQQLRDLLDAELDLLAERVKLIMDGGMR